MDGDCKMTFLVILWYIVAYVIWIKFYITQAHDTIIFHIQCTESNVDKKANNFPNQVPQALCIRAV